MHTNKSAMENRRVIQHPLQSLGGAGCEILAVAKDCKRGEQAVFRIYTAPALIIFSRTRSCRAAALTLGVYPCTSSTGIYCACPRSLRPRNGNTRQADAQPFPEERVNAITFSYLEMPYTSCDGLLGSAGRGSTNR